MHRSRRLIITHIPFDAHIVSIHKHSPSKSPTYSIITHSYSQQHLAATGADAEILREFLAQGASVHLRNNAGRTPLFLAAQAGLATHVRLLRAAGAHLHSGELEDARVLAAAAAGRDGEQKDGVGDVWTQAGLESR